MGLAVAARIALGDAAQRSMKCRIPVSSSGMLRRVSALTGLALLATLAAGCGIGTRSAATPHSSSTTTRHSVELEISGLTVTPSAGLQDAQQVSISVKGFPRDAKYFLSECLSPTDVNAAGCGNQLAVQPFGMTDDLGSGSASFTVQSSAASERYIRTTQPCTGACVIVATAGVDGAFSFAPITFAPRAVAPPGTHSCTNGQVTVSDNGGGAGLGHEVQVLVFTNDTRSECTLTGYPGVAGLDAAGAQAAQARRTLNGYLGGLLPGATSLPVVSLAPGQTASAIAEGTDNPVGPQPCPHYPALLITPPGLTKQVQVDVTDLGAQGFPGCSGIEVHPVVPGSSGSSLGF